MREDLASSFFSLSPSLCSKERFLSDREESRKDIRATSTTLEAEKKGRRSSLCPSRDLSTIKGLTAMADETARNFAPSRRVASHQESDGCESQRPRVVERRYKLFDAPRIDLSAGESFEPCRSRFPCPVGHSTNPSCPFLLPRFRCQDQWIGCHQW